MNSIAGAQRATWQYLSVAAKVMQILSFRAKQGEGKSVRVNELSDKAVKASLDLALVGICEGNSESYFETEDLINAICETGLRLEKPRDVEIQRLEGILVAFPDIEMVDDHKWRCTG